MFNALHSATNHSPSNRAHSFHTPLTSPLFPLDVGSFTQGKQAVKNS